MRTQYLFALLAATSTLLAGCAGLDPAISPAQLTAAAKDREATVHCGTYDTLATDVSVMRVNVDKGVVESGSIEVKCGGNSVTYTNAKAPK